MSALLRREGIYSSHLTSWRKQRNAGQFGKSPRKRGPVATPPDPRDAQIAELERNLRKAQARGDRYERLCALQTKVSELLGLQLPDPDEALQQDEGVMKLVDQTSKVEGIEATCDALDVCRATYYRHRGPEVYWVAHRPPPPR